MSADRHVSLQMAEAQIGRARSFAALMRHVFEGGIASASEVLDGLHLVSIEIGEALGEAARAFDTEAVRPAAAAP